MNRQIVKLFGFIVVLFAVLVGFTSYWSVFDAKALKEKEANKRPLLEQQQIRRGRILAADGTVIARSVPKGQGRRRCRYVRRYPEGELFGHPIGYSFVQPGQLRVRAVPQRRAGRRRIGIQLDLRRAPRRAPGRQRHRHQHRRGGPAGGARRRCEAVPGFGAVVAIEPSTGKVKVLASNAPYDPNRVPYELEQAEPQRARSAAASTAAPSRATRRARPSRW